MSVRSALTRMVIGGVLVIVGMIGVLLVEGGTPIAVDPYFEISCILGIIGVGILFHVCWKSNLF